MTTVFARRSFSFPTPSRFASRLSYDGGPPSVGDDRDDGASGDDGASKCEPNGIAASYGVERGPLLKMELDEMLALSLSARRCVMEAYSPPLSRKAFSVASLRLSPACGTPAISFGSPSTGPASRAPAEEKSTLASSGRGRAGRNSPLWSNASPETTRRRVGVPGALTRVGDGGDDEASSEARAGAAPALDCARFDTGGDISTPRTPAR